MTDDTRSTRPWLLRIIIAIAVVVVVAAIVYTIATGQRFL
ncbi:hypothetical protein EDF46_1775 [Frondihabitans sp. PhB188]|nr:hypothetical protein EDF46_1775 [Frondihabitans sp. PhB188]